MGSNSYFTALLVSHRVHLELYLCIVWIPFDVNQRIFCLKNITYYFGRWHHVKHRNNDIFSSWIEPFWIINTRNRPSLDRCDPADQSLSITTMTSAGHIAMGAHDDWYKSFPAKWYTLMRKDTVLNIRSTLSNMRNWSIWRHHEEICSWFIRSFHTSSLIFSRQRSSLINSHISCLQHSTVL